MSSIIASNRDQETRDFRKQVIHLLTKILHAVSADSPYAPRRLALFINTGKGDIEMKAGLNVQIQDDGKGALCTLQLLDDVGMPAVVPANATLGIAPWSSSDATVIGVTADPSGLTAKLALATPIKLGTGIVITAGPLTYTDPTGKATVLAAVTGTLDVIAGGPAGMQMVITPQ